MRKGIYANEETLGLKIILIIVLTANILGGITLWFTNRERFWLAVLPTIIIQAIAIIILNKNRYHESALILGISLVYTSILTTFLSDLSRSFNNPLIPIMMAILIIGVFSYKLFYTIVIISWCTFSTVIFSIKILSDSDFNEALETIIANILTFLIISIIGITSTNMNKKRYKLNNEVIISNKRLLAGEKLKASELLMPALSHELASPVVNAKAIAEIIINEIKKDSSNFSNEIIDSIDILDDSLLRISSVLDRYRVKTLEFDNLKLSSINELLIFLYNKLKIIYEDIFNIHILGSENIQISKNSIITPVIYDIIENSIIHGRGSKLSIVNIYIDWKLVEKQELKKLGFDLENNGVINNGNKKYLLITIKDDGVGIKSEKIIDMNKPILKSLGGKSVSSLGLYLSKLRLEHSYNGKISIENYSNGVIVKIIIPNEYLISVQ